MPVVAQRADTTADDAGFTLVELIVSLTILAIGVVGVIGVMNSSFGVAVRTNERSRAVNLATREIEAIRAVPYNLLIPTGTTETRTETVGGTTFTIEKAATWGTRGTNLYAVKDYTVTVRWSSSGTVHDISQVTTVYPGGLGPKAPPPNDPCGGAGTPNGPIALVAGAPGLLSETAVDLAWTPPASTSTPIATWRIDMTTGGGDHTITTTHPVSSLVYRVDGLSANTTYSFKVAGVSACGKVSAWSPVRSVTTLASALTTCNLGTPSVTPASARRANNGNSAGLAVTPKVAVNTTGTCTGMYIKYEATAGVTRTQFMSTGSVKTVDITAAGPWDIGVHTIDIYDNTNAKRGSLLLTVCAHNASSC